MKYLITLAAFTVTLIIMLQFEFPLFWQVIAAVITSMGVFFGFNTDSATNEINDNQQEHFSAVEDINDYLPINEYNKRFGVAVENIKQKILQGELNGTRYNGIWYIHKDELTKQ